MCKTTKNVVLGSLVVIVVCGMGLLLLKKRNTHPVGVARAEQILVKKSNEEMQESENASASALIHEYPAASGIAVPPASSFAQWEIFRKSEKFSKLSFTQEQILSFFEIPSALFSKEESYALVLLALEGTYWIEYDVLREGKLFSVDAEVFYEKLHELREALYVGIVAIVGERGCEELLLASVPLDDEEYVRFDIAQSNVYRRSPWWDLLVR